MTDPRHYRDRLADETTALVRRKLPTMLPNVLTDAQALALLTLIARAVSSAVDELDARELWRTD